MSFLTNQQELGHQRAPHVCRDGNYAVVYFPVVFGFSLYSFLSHLSFILFLYQRVKLYYTKQLPRNEMIDVRIVGV